METQLLIIFYVNLLVAEEDENWESRGFKKNNFNYKKEFLWQFVELMK